jgi:PKD repeat protein
MKQVIGFRRGVLGWAILLSAVLAGGVSAQTTDVYFIGNSFTSTFWVNSIFEALSASGGHTAKTAVDIIGGSELKQHWAYDPSILPIVTSGAATNSIAHTNYNYVVLQEGSTVAYTPSIESNFNIYAPLFDTVITNSGAQTVLYMTWVREDQLSALPYAITLYRNMAAQLGCKVAPVGEAWRRVMEQNPSLDLFDAVDRHHPNQKGAYLAGCNFYGTIFNESPEGLSMRTVGGMTLDATEAAFLQRIAWDAVQFVSYTNPPVISSMTVDQAVRTNSTPFTFQAAASDNGSITDYLWSFGDGTATNGLALTNVVHTYTNDGVFPVTVKVTDNSGETERTGLSVTRDTTGPQVSDIAVTRTMLTVRFNQDVQEASAETATNYAISGGGAISVISATQTTGDVVRLEVSELSPGITYTLTLNNIYSALGMKIYPNTTKDFTYVDGSNMHLRFDFGSSNNPTAGNWNNITYLYGDLVVSNAIDIYGVPRNVGLRFTPTTAPNYGSVNYGVSASNLYPFSAQYDCVTGTRKFSYQIEGLDPAAEYRLTFFASYHATNRETLFSVGTSNVALDCAFNTNRLAVIEGIKSDINGNVVFSINTNTVAYCYLSVLELQDTTPPILKNIETSVGALDITEGTTSNILVRLSSLPASNVTVSVNASGYAHVQVLSESSFVYFATTNWDVWQPVYVEALSDTDTDNGTATIQFADVGGVYTVTNVYATQLDTTLPAETAGFTADPTTGWAPLAVTFTDTSTISGITNRFWNFGDGTTTNTTATHVTHTYTSAGTNTVQLIVSSPSSSGTNTQVNLISVSLLVAPSAGFTVSTNSGTVPLAVTFTDTSAGNITNRTWSFGDGATTNTTATSVPHTYTVAGTNTVQLIVSGPGGASTNTQVAAVIVTIPPAPVASFSAAPTSGAAPLPVTFTDTSTGSITNRSWNFGDGAVTNTTATSVLHTYSAAGTNTVQLIVRGLGGASTNTQSNLISVAAASQGALLVEEHFDYAVTNLTGNTPAIGGTWGGGGSSVVLGSGLGSPSGFAAASGNEIKIGTSGAAQTNRFATVTNGTVYMSYLIQFNSLKNVGAMWGGLSLNGAAEYAQLQYTNTAGNTTYYQLGLGGRSSTFGTNAMLSTQFTVGQTQLVVVAYTIVTGSANDIMSLWVNPDSSFFGAGSAPAADLTQIATTEAGSLNTIDIKNSSTLPSGTILDEMRVGTTWASVTPTASAPPVSKYIETSTNALDITEGSTNSFQVRLNSQPDASVTVSVSRVSGETNVQVAAGSASVIFATTNWNAWQPVYIAALIDANTNNGTATIQCADAGGLYNPTNILATQIDTVMSRDVSQFGITWKLVGGGQIGQYANGDNWVVGPVTVIEISPASTNNAGWINNGSQLNPVVSGTQGYDNMMAYMAYDAAKNAARPGGNDLSAGNPLVISDGSLVSTISQSTISNRPQVQAAAILTVVSSAPAAGSFRPPPVGSDKTSYWNKSNLNYSILKALTPVPGTPALTNVTVQFERPWIEQNGEWTARYIHPVDNQPDYGREIAHALAEGLLSLHLNYSNAQKEPLYIRLVQYGIDVYGAAKGGSIWRDLGGHNQGRKMPMMLAGLAFNDTNILAYADASKHFIFQEDMQTWYVRQYDVGRVVYTNDGRPRVQYIQADVGIPEWGEQHTSQEERDGRNWDAYYRDNVYSGCMGHALAAHLMPGIVSQWNWPAFFDYMDRAFAIEGTNASDNAMTIQTYVANMWNAYRAQCDADGDGISDSWEAQYFGGSTNANPNSMAANGVNTVMESYVAGLNPTNAQSVFTVTNRMTAAQSTLQWSSVSGRVYSVYWTTNLFNSFQPLASNIAWPQNSWTDAVHGAEIKNFYRIKVQMGQ